MDLLGYWLDFHV